MADIDLTAVVFEMKGSLTEILKRQDRTDEHLSEQDRQHAVDKQAAISARDEKHKENQAAIQTLDERITTALGIASSSDAWIKETGKPLVVRVAALEVGRVAKASKDKGEAGVWAIVGGAIVMAGSVAVFMGKESIASLLSKIAAVLNR